MSNALLDIIITHHDEPWKLGKPFFDMLENQRLADMDKIRIHIVQDGRNNSLPWKELLKNYSFPVKVYTVEEHNGIAHARNVGISKAEADWIMFFNFDDSFADVCAMAMILDQFPTDEADIIWCKIAQEQKWYTGTVYVNCVDGVSFANTDGKLYRTSFLQKNKIYFPVHSKYYYDHVFNSIALAVTDPWRIAMLTTSFYPIYKTFRIDSFRHTEEAHIEMIDSVFDRDCMIADFLRSRGYTHEFKRTMAKAICGQYYVLYDPETQEKSTAFPQKLIDYYKENRELFKSISHVDIDPICAEAEVESLNAIQFFYNEHKKEYYLMNDDITFDDWIERLDIEAGYDIEKQKQQDDITEAPVILTAETEHEPRVVVYCGTYDVYMNMVASCKSLLATTPVDKVYFLIEDDKFPYDIPDIVTTINIKSLAFDLFDQDGPNFNNSWTYMCMIRTAFPDLFSQYDKILSLDVDVVINDNVSDLWDYDISDYYLAGVPERQRQKSTSDPLYINFGVVMMNLAKLREDGLQQKLVDALNTRKFGCPEQDCYNKFCAGHILDLPNDYNFTTYSHITGEAQNERIIHYAGQKFWRHYSLVKRYADRSWDDIMSAQNNLKGV